MKPIQFEDLLGRDEININLEKIAEQVSQKVIMITGGAGSIGSELVRQLATFQPKLIIIYDIAETPLHNLRLEMERKFPNQKFVPIIGDVRSKERLEFVFRKYKPEIIYHAAAYKHVPLMEENPCEAILTNVLGTLTLSNMAVANGIENFVMISTDKAVNPTNVMGASKRIAEIYIQSLAHKTKQEGKNLNFVTTRFGNVLGSNGSVIPFFKEQIEKGGPITVTHPDIIRYFMTIPEACRLVMEAASFGKTGQIYVFDMGEPVKIVDLARRMIKLAGFVPDKDIKIEFVGLRPGEKLYEELLNDKEKTVPTDHEKITIATVRQYNFEEIVEAIESMISKATEVDIDTTVKLMKKLVPEFLSQNSPFEHLDKK
jgi:FlaA1/EpsC-like NDP-sugar epimerase